jgi:hypothetical protein
VAPEPNPTPPHRSGSFVVLGDDGQPKRFAAWHPGGQPGLQLIDLLSQLIDSRQPRFLQLATHPAQVRFAITMRHNVTLKRTQSLLGSNNKWRFFNGDKSRRHRGKLPEGYDMKFISRDSSNRLDGLRSLN